MAVVTRILYNSYLYVYQGRENRTETTERNCCEKSKRQSYMETLI
jgi:hypothetical protein